MKHAVLITLAAMIAAALCPNVHGQSATAQITGTITDSSGAAMTQVKITVSSTQTGLTRETRTGDSGNYAFPLLPVGVYALTAEQAGFKVQKRTDIRLNVDQVARLDLTMDVG
ncbi:MAG: carboxypeptidase-like regulatory domain-containing protein, partial [Bryobacteraceae bacterium]